MCPAADASPFLKVLRAPLAYLNLCCLFCGGIFTVAVQGEAKRLRMTSDFSYEISGRHCVRQDKRSGRLEWDGPGFGRRYVLMAEKTGSEKLIDEFIRSQVLQKGLDERTAKAYRLDLEHLHQWLALEPPGGRERWEGKIEAYLEYLSSEKNRRPSTICRKQRVFGYYLAYLSAQGIIKEARPLKNTSQKEEPQKEVVLTKKEIDSFFQAISREYEDLDSDFRKRVCLRDQVMMSLLFYHGIEISELLRLEVGDYNRKSAVLTVRRKNGKDYSMRLFSRRLQEQMAVWLDEHGYFERGKGYDERMFLSKLGRPLSMKMVTNIFDKYRVLAGIERECSPKDLKRSLGRYAEEVVREGCG